MRNIKNISLIILTSIIASTITSCSYSPKTAKTTHVEVISTNGVYQLLKDGEVFFIKGAGLESANMESLKKHGGNSFRTWRVNSKNNTGKEILDKAQSFGLNGMHGN